MLNRVSQVAKAELLKLEHQLMEEKKQREKELADRRALVQQKVEMNQRMEKRDKMRREMALVEGGEQADAGEANMKKNLFSTAFHSALNEHVLEEEQKKITTYEGACTPTHVLDLLSKLRMQNHQYGRGPVLMNTAHEYACLHNACTHVLEKLSHCSTRSSGASCHGCRKVDGFDKILLHS